jgi:hypothetical protein
MNAPKVLVKRKMSLDRRPVFSLDRVAELLQLSHSHTVPSPTIAREPQTVSGFTTFWFVVGGYTVRRSPPRSVLLYLGINRVRAVPHSTQISALVAVTVAVTPGRQRAPKKGCCGDGRVGRNYDSFWTVSGYFGAYNFPQSAQVAVHFRGVIRPVDVDRPSHEDAAVFGHDKTKAVHTTRWER